MLSNRNIAMAAFFSLSSPLIFGQVTDSLIPKNIEIVRIIKHQSNKKIMSSPTGILDHDAGNLLNNLPEIGGRKIAGSYATDPVLRGFKFEQLNIISDGSITSIQACPSRMDPPTSQINLNLVKEVEIYKGPYQFRFGNAFGGSINFVSVAPEFTSKPEFSGRLATAYESNKATYRNEILTRFFGPKFNWDLSGSYQKGDDYKDGHGKRVPSAFERYNMGSRISYLWNKQHLSTAQITTNQARDVKFATGMMDLMKDNTWLYVLKHDIRPQNSILKNLSLSGFLSSVDHTMGTQDKSMISRIKSTSAGGRTELKMQWDKNLLYSGVDFRHDAEKNIPQGMTLHHHMGHHMSMGHNNPWQNGQINRMGWFHEFQRKWNHNKITASYRMDYSHAAANTPTHFFMMKYGEHLSSHQTTNSFSLSYNRILDPHQQISILIGRGERSASITERYINFFPLGNDNYQYIGNPYLKPEKNYQVDWVYSYQHPAMNIQLDVFYSHLKDFISSEITKAIKPTSMRSKGVREFTNIGKAYKTGIEGSVQWKITRYLNAEMAAAYTYAQNKSQGIPLPEIAPLDTRFRMESQLKRFKLGAEIRYVGSQRRVNPLFGERSTQDFTILNIDAHVEIFKNFTAFLQFKNVFNKAYTEYLNKSTYTSGYTERFLSPGRNFSITCSYHF
ncbi:TonB-dependent receptor [Elizabethkingia argentiflava]|uniref:TonB-dependent receptor n=1 Tax=Elizabethkingia argenteiflava TaxID=2681556 RepID=A0A845PW74_9FLAO|nr:TonB-dependent receptor [Elizabethkingia argenteiflava]NAW50707.1 TonB-dependent receptor [Elizabethkingia argenteiflava]